MVEPARFMHSQCAPQQCVKNACLLSFSRGLNEHPFTWNPPTMEVESKIHLSSPIISLPLLKFFYQFLCYQFRSYFFYSHKISANNLYFVIKRGKNLVIGFKENEWSDGKLSVERGNSFYQYIFQIFIFLNKKFLSLEGSRVLKKLTRKTRVFFIFSIRK